jgi:hypothetical protein
MTTTTSPLDSPERPVLLDTGPKGRRGEGARIVLILVGGLVALIAAGFIAAGGAGLWLNGQKDADGFVSTGDHRFEARTAAIVSENLDLDLSGVRDFFDDDDLGTVRLAVEANDEGRPVFAGIARTADVERYLAGVSTSTVTSLNYWPFDADYDDRLGPAGAKPPARQDIWVATTTSAGGELNWKVADGDWSVVLMNADGSPGVDADLDAGAKIPDLAAISWALVGGGVLVLLGGAALIVTGIRRPRGTAPATA